MGKTGSWIHSIKKAVHNHLVGDIDPHKFQHLPTGSKGGNGGNGGATQKSRSDSRDRCSTASSHVVVVAHENDDEHRRSSSSSSHLVVGGSGHNEQEEKRRSSTSSQLRRSAGGGHHHEKSPKHDKAGRRSDVSAWQANGESRHHDSPPSSSHRDERASGHHKYNDEEIGGEQQHHSTTPRELYRNSEKRRGAGDHSHLVKLFKEERAGGSSNYNPFYDRSNKEEQRSFSTSSENGTAAAADELSAAYEKENPRYSTGRRVSHDEEKRITSTSSQKARSVHEKSPVEKGRSSNVSSTHNERTVLEKARSSAHSNHNVKTPSSSFSSENRRPGTPSSPNERTKSLIENSNTQPENRRPSTDRGRPRTPSSPRIAQAGQAAMQKTHSDKSRSTTGPASFHQQHSVPAGPYAQLGRNIALQDLLKPGSFERKSSSSSTMSVSHAGGSARSITSEGSNTSEDFVELVYPHPETTRTSLPHPPSPASINHRKKVVIATIKEVFSLVEQEAPVSPGSQRRKSGNFGTKPLVPLPELGTKPLLPPNYRKQQPAVAGLGAVAFHAGDAGVGGMLGEWAAVMIQSSWRGYFVRQAFKALRGLVKLQACVRGYLVRKKMRPLVNARIQAARVRNKLRKNAMCILHPISNTYGIPQTVHENRSSQYGFAQPVLDDSPTPAARKSARTREAFKCEVSDWSSHVTLCSSAELKQEVFMKKEKAKQH